MAFTKRLIVFIILVVFFATFVRHIVKVVWLLGVFNTKHSHMPGPCRVIDGINTGSEDIEVLPNGFAFVSSGMTWPYFPRNTSIRTGIYGFDFNKPDEGFVQLPMEGNFQQNGIISYHGLSIWQDKTGGEVTLFAISHRQEKETVEIFHFDKTAKTLRHRQTIESPNFFSLNDLVATGPSSFYATNDGSIRWPSTRDRLAFVELLLFLHHGSVVYYDGTSASVVIDGELMANGINLSPDESLLYVSICGGKTVNVYKRNQDNSVTEIRKIDVHLIPDNVYVHKDTGDIWTVGPYGPFTLGDHTHAPISVIRIQDKDGGIKIEELLSDDGRQISFGSVAARYGNLLLIGTVNNIGMLCELRSIG